MPGPDEPDAARSGHGGMMVAAEQGRKGMWAARLHAPGDIRLAEEPVPAAGPPVTLVRVTAVGICGSDLHWWDDAGIGDARLERPLVLGHENAGVIAGGPRRGQRVAIDPAIPDETCPQCRRGYRNLCPQVRFAGHGVTDGGLSEFLAWPTSLLYPLPDVLSDADGALLEPLGVALHALDLGHLRLGQSAAVIGCGPIGLMLIQLLLAGGASRVVAADPLPHRRQAAVRFGAQAAGPEPAAEGAADVDTAFEVAETDDAVHAAMTVVRPGGRVVLAGIPDGDRTSFRASVARRKGLTIAMSRRMNDAYPRAIALAASGRVDLASLVTRTVPLAEVADAFATVARREGLKVVVRPAA